MAKTLEQNLQEQLGAMAFQIAFLNTQLEQVKEELDALKAKQPKAPKSDSKQPEAVN